MPHFTPGLSTVPGSQALNKHRKVVYVVDTGTLTDCCQCDAYSHKGLTERQPRLWCLPTAFTAIQLQTLCSGSLFQEGN